MNSFTHGFMVTAGLILAIGAQNAYLLKLGLTRQHVLPSVLICIASDALLIGLGIAGMGRILDQWPQVLWIATWGGSAFLAWYAFNSLRAAFARRSLSIQDGFERISLRTATTMILAFTYLNPHVYLDTMVLIGSLGGRLPNAERLGFWAGCIGASTVWFISLGFGARWLSPLFANPRSWRVLDALIGLSMGLLAVNLVH
ncbi:LysE/ArgO family amino acid transporter [Uliginosibacterium gangwonense]|uniref:LysE/ArgO family amino acid transporter n=1 Tax=Uliginosibacterium gangwonense TaxID=392736 RepID=UPI00037E5D7A|nr:LysE/ArgO family amino acid transporter [Uliginosibacterium gangwonense]